MASLRSIFFMTLLAFFGVSSSTAFVGMGGGATGGSAFVVSQHASVASKSPINAPPQPRRHAAGVSSLYMGKMAKFGVFSPAVYGAKVVLGSDRLNKIRGKAIALHSEKIGQFCEWAGAYHLRTRLIKKAKTNGDTLGFLV